MQIEENDQEIPDYLTCPITHVKITINIISFNL
jgi:hypothetical protein